METKTYELDLSEGKDIISANEKNLTGKAILTIFDKMGSRDDRVSLAAAEAALRVYGKDQPAKKDNAPTFLACFSKPEQLAGLLQGLMGMAQLAIPQDAETPAVLDPKDVGVEIVE